MTIEMNRKRTNEWKRTNLSKMTPEQKQKETNDNRFRC